MLIPQPLIGRFVTCSINAVTVASDGTATIGTSIPTIGQLDRIEQNFSSDLENISPMDSRGKNNVPLEDDFTVSLVEILKQTGNLLAPVFFPNDYIQVIVNRGAVVITFVGCMESYNEGLEKGKSVGTLTVRPVITGAANPTAV